MTDMLKAIEENPFLLRFGDGQFFARKKTRKKRKRSKRLRKRKKRKKKSRNQNVNQNQKRGGSTSMGTKADRPSNTESGGTTGNAKVPVPPKPKVEEDEEPEVEEVEETDKPKKQGFLSWFL